MLQVVEGARLEPDKFCFWLQGFCELHGEPPTAEQWKHIKEHLELVFVKAVPQPQKQQPIPDGGAMRKYAEQHILQSGGSIMIC